MLDTYVNKHQNQLVLINKKDINISTMTILVTFQDSINLIDLKKENTPEYFLKYNSEHMIPKGKKTGNEFMNQYTIKYKDENGRKNIKIFPNGKIHITGVKSFNEIKYISDSVILFSGKKNKVTNIEICLLNTNFHVGIGLNLHNLGEIIKNQEERDVNVDIPLSFYDPNKYPGLKLKYNGTSILIFSSGSIMIAGGKTISSIELCVNFIKKLIDKNYDYVSCKELTKFRKKK